MQFGPDYLTLNLPVTETPCTQEREKERIDFEDDLHVVTDIFPRSLHEGRDSLPLRLREFVRPGPVEFEKLEVSVSVNLDIGHGNGVQGGALIEG
jgi:hypothetical protein